jgi:GT2 family glycosyltransferase
VIICSIDDRKFTAAEQMYRRLLGESAQIIRITDAKGMCEGYNRGIAQSSGDVLIFSHDDVEILSPDYAQKLQRHLQSFDIVGLAGTTRLVAGYWIAAGPPYIFGQVGHTAKPGPYHIQFFGGHGPVIENIKVVDGLMFAVRRAVIEKIRFDESFDSFHLYDLDFCTQAHAAGFRLAVARDIAVIHDSQGSFDQRWRQYAAKFEKKWAARLQPHPNRPFHIQLLDVKTKDEILEVMKTTI